MFLCLNTAYRTLMQNNDVGGGGVQDEDSVLESIFRSKRKELSGGCRKLHNEGHYNL
jgi:hypothetical protein